MQEINYKNIRNITSNISWYERNLSEHLCMSLSPLVSILFIKKGIKPNTVTLLMVACGIIAPLLLMVENIYIQCLSAFLFILWFVFDCSDGEVARFTSTFSKYGRDLDYLSHISCHSLFVMAMWKLFAYQSELLFPLSMLFFTLLASELFYRMSVLYTVYILETTEANNPTANIKHKLWNNILMNLTYFPNFVVFFPTLYCVSVLLSINILPFFVALFSIYILVKIKSYIRIIIRFYIS